MARLALADLAAGYGPAPVLFDVSLPVGDGEIVALLGAKGAGKTTTPRTIAGLVTPAAGSVPIDGAPVGGRPPDRSPASVCNSSPKAVECPAA